MEHVTQKDMLIQGMISSGALKNDNIIKAFKKIDRRDFVPPDMRKYAYSDTPMEIMKGQTISQPTTVAIMTEALEPEKGNNILEVGTGSGYQAAILSEITGNEGKITTIERIPELYDYARQRLEKYRNVNIIFGDGSLGFEKSAPYDRIIVTAASPVVPDPLKNQLRTGGIMVIPVGGFTQKMLVLTKGKDGFKEKDLGYFMFVPLLGKHGFNE